MSEHLNQLEALARAVRAMREQAIANQTWYTFVTCEYGEAVDDALADIYSWPSVPPAEDEGDEPAFDVPRMTCRELSDAELFGDDLELPARLITLDQVAAALDELGTELQLENSIASYLAGAEMMATKLGFQLLKDRR